MKILSYLLTVAVVGILAIIYAAPDWIIDPPIHRDAMTSISGECPDGEFVRGFDKETGAVTCGHVTGCPYGDSVPLGPDCDRLAPIVVQPVQPIAPPDFPAFQGK